jgi:hypothetical protein
MNLSVSIRENVKETVSLFKRNPNPTAEAPSREKETASSVFFP